MVQLISINNDYYGIRVKAKGNHKLYSLYCTLKNPELFNIIAESELGLGTEN